MQLPEYDPGAAVAGWLHSLAALLTDATSPFWWPSLVAAGLAAVALAVLAGGGLRDLPARMFPHGRRAFLRELPVDLACFLAGSALPFLLGPLFFALSWGGMMLGVVLLGPLCGLPSPEAPPPGPLVLVLAAIAAFVAGDFMLYWSHRLFHRVPLLWRAHRLHHAPSVLTPLTAFRFWPQEHLVHLSGNMLGQGFGLGVVTAVAGTPVSAFTLLGVNVVSLLWGLAFAHLRHSHVPLAFPRWLCVLLVSPHMHQAHHSVETRHHDRNFGTALAVWDWMFGTLYRPAPEERFRFGLDAPPEAAPQQGG